MSSTVDYQTQLEEQLALIKTAISNALTNPKPNWRVGQVWMNHGDYIATLFKSQKEIIGQLKAIPNESVDTYQNATSEFGSDENCYHDEEC